MTQVVAESRNSPERRKHVEQICLHGSRGEALSVPPLAIVQLLGMAYAGTQRRRTRRKPCESASKASPLHFIAALALLSNGLFRSAAGITRLTRCFATPAFNLNNEILGGLAPSLDQIPNSAHDLAEFLSSSGNFLGAVRDR